MLSSLLLDHEVNAITARATTLRRTPPRDSAAAPVAALHLLADHVPARASIIWRSASEALVQPCFCHQRSMASAQEPKQQTEADDDETELQQPERELADGWHVHQAPQPHQQQPHLEQRGRCRDPRAQQRMRQAEQAEATRPPGESGNYNNDNQAQHGFLDHHTPREQPRQWNTCRLPRHTQPWCHSRTQRHARRTSDTTPVASSTTNTGTTHSGTPEAMLSMCRPISDATRSITVCSTPALLIVSFHRRRFRTPSLATRDGRVIPDVLVGRLAHRARPAHPLAAQPHLAPRLVDLLPPVLLPRAGPLVVRPVATPPMRTTPRIARRLVPARTGQVFRVAHVVHRPGLHIPELVRLRRRRLSVRGLADDDVRQHVPALRLDLRPVPACAFRNPDLGPVGFTIGLLRRKQPVAVRVIRPAQLGPLLR